MVLPIELLENLSSCKTSLLLKDGRILKGKLVGWDQFMNIILEGAEEKKGDLQRRLGTILLRGNNVVSISSG
jgi:small nuclear ribonucleoprotein